MFFANDYLHALCVCLCTLLLLTTYQLFTQTHTQALPHISVMRYYLSAYCMAPSCDGATSHPFIFDFFV